METNYFDTPGPGLKDNQSGNDTADQEDYPENGSLSDTSEAADEDETETDDGDSFGDDDGLDEDETGSQGTSANDVDGNGGYADDADEIEEKD